MAFLKLALKNRIALLDRVKRNSVIGTTGYYVYSLARVQQLQVGDYTLTVGRTVSTDAVAMNVGDVFTLEISKNGTSVDGTKYVGGPNKDLFLSMGKLCYVVSEGDSVYYYHITLEENDNSSVENEGVKNVATYKSATVDKFTATVMTEKEHEKRYVEIVDGKVMRITLYSNVYYVKECVFDAATGTYTVTTTDDKVYEVVLEGDYVTIAAKA